MEHPVTINIGKLVDKIEIKISGTEKPANLETAIQEALIKAVNLTSFEHVQNHNTSRHCNSSKSRISEERDYRAHYNRYGSSLAKAKDESIDNHSNEKPIVIIVF